MNNLPILLKPQFRGNRPTPFFSKLLFPNKILFIIFLLLTFFGLIGAITLHFILKYHLSKEYQSRFLTISQSLSHRLEPMILAKDEKGISYLLTEVSKFNQGIVYLMVTDSRGKPWIKIINKITEHDTKADTHEIAEVVMPITYNNQTIGAIKSGFSGLPLQASLNQVMTIYLSILSAMIIISLLIARSFLRYTTKPILTLTRIADEISLGNLDIDIVFGQHVNCWKIKQCGRKDCVAYTNTTIQCWFVDGTPCKGYEPKFPQKLEGCRKCEVYKTHKGDEIVQLADSFQHMIYMLKSSQAELEDSLKFQRNLIQNSLIGIIATNEVGMIRIFNRVAENLTGYSESEVIDTLTFTNLFPEISPSRLIAPSYLIMVSNYGGLNLRSRKF